MCKIKSIRTKPFSLDNIIYGGREEEYCTREQITQGLIADIKQGIAEGKIYFVLALTEEEKEDQFRLEFSKGLQEENWLDIEIIYTDVEGTEHIFMFCDEKYIKENEKFEGQKEFDQKTISKSSCCYDFGVAAKIFEKWAVTGELCSGLWWHQWDDGDDHFELEEIS